MRRLAPLPLLLLLLAPEAAGAAKVLDTRVTCKPVTVFAPAAGRLDVSVAGRGDWDVELRDAAGRIVAAGASPDGREVASGLVAEAGALSLKACGGSGTAAVTVTHAAVERGAKPQLVSVSTPTRADKDRLVALGLDMTEHGGTKSLGVVLHGDADKAALRDAGLTWKAVQAAPDVQASAAGVLPSGRTSYRTLADYESEMKALAAANPSFVRLFTLPHRTYEGREVLGLEIAENVTANDGRPAFLNMGVHHAREWPAGELTMEWAYELINGYKAGAARATNIVRGGRNLVVPIVNPDGFNASRSAGPANGRDETIDDTVYIATSPGEYRRKNCRVGDTETALCPISLGLAENGVDPNRNYGQFWGGPGSDTNPLTQTYRGPAPFSEPESRNVRALVSRNHVTTLITNHTTAGLVLRAPGLAAVGDPVDEHRGYKQLGDDMARHNGYFSQKGFELYDTTGTTEDWSYNATGGYGFTFELYCGAPNYATGDCDAPAFHPRFATMAKEWDGSSAQADHANDPGPDKGFDGQGNREAYYLAAESTIDETRHSIIEGTAPAGTTLRLTKAFKTAAFDPAITVDDRLETTYDVGASGTYRWHVNPSTRPLVAKETGSPNPGEPSAPQSASGGVTAPGAFNDHAFAVPAGDNASAAFRVQWTTPVSDWDAELYRDLNGNGALDAGEPSVGSSAQGLTDFEEITVAEPSGAYILRVTNYAAAEGYAVTVTYAAPPPHKPAQTESYTLTCERDGTVLATQPVVVERGASVRVDPCPAASGGASASAAPAACGAATAPCPAARPACLATPRLAVRPSGRGLRAGSAAALYRVASARRVTAPKLVASLRAGTWNRRVADGYYVARTGEASLAFRRANGRFTRLGAFEHRSCGSAFTLSGPVFDARGLRISSNGPVTVQRGGKVVKRLARGGTFRTARRGEYRVSSGGITLVSRRL